MAVRNPGVCQLAGGCFAVGLHTPAIDVADFNGGKGSVAAVLAASALLARVERSGGDKADDGKEGSELGKHGVFVDCCRERG